MKFSFEQWLILLFVLTISGIVTIGLVAFKNNNAFNDTNYWVRHAEDVLNESQKILELQQNIETGERGYAITGDTDFLEPFLNSYQSVLAHIQQLRTLTDDNPVQQRRIDSLSYYVTAKINFVQQVIDLKNSGNDKEVAALIATKKGKVFTDKFHLWIDNIQTEENNLLNKRRAANERTILIFNHIMLSLFTSLLFIAVISFWSIRDNLKKRTKLEDENRRSSLFLNTILENIPNMIFVKDVIDLRFVRFNRAGEQLLGEPRENMIGKNDYDFFPKEEADFFTSKDKEVIATGSLIDIPEEPIETKNGLRWLHTKKIPIADENGNPVYLLGISEDITGQRNYLEEIRMLNAELQRTITQLLAANKEMEAFTYSVSHDLRAPLRIIDGFGGMLLKDYAEKLDSEGVRNLNVIMQNARRMGQLIDDLLNLSRLGKAQLSVKRVDMHEIVEDVIAALKVVDHKLTTKINVGALCPAECDLSLMRQVWVNLISNAIKYSSKKEAALIEIGCELKNGETVYYVKDNGVGFDMKYAHKLFGVFQRLHKVSEFEGTGVGLALVHRIVTRHNGKIWADAKVDEGAVFYFTLG